MIRDLKPDRDDINTDVCDLYFALYMDGEWGVQVGYVLTPSYIADTQKTLLDWQEQSDCCTLAPLSIQTQAFTILQYAVLPSTVQPCSPYQPLFAGNCYRGCLTS